MKHLTRKATRNVSQNEGLIFEKSSPGKAAWRLAPLDVPEVNAGQLLGSSERKDLGNLPEVSEIEIIRHFTRLSTWNYAIDLGMYPLGSCTMKYNPRVNEVVARLDGLANGHPYQPGKISQGGLRIIKTLSDCLIEITGMDRSEEHTSELQSHLNLVCRLLLEKKKIIITDATVCKTSTVKKYRVT